MRVYIAGPISADPTRTIEEKIAAFTEAERLLEAEGHEVTSPIKVPIDCGMDAEECASITRFPDRRGQGHAWECYMAHDLSALVLCDAIMLLPGWDESPGARLEWTVAWSLRMEILYP